MENSELMGILEQLERDKGIQKEVLIDAVESAVASAARKLWTVDRDEDIRVVLDPNTGKLTAYAGDEEIRSNEFGRIAAQTAKQVVIQKIREAEKDVVFGEYQTRVGEILSGSVYRFEKGNIVVDIGKAEAILPRREQSSKEEFKQGDRIRSYVLDVKRDHRGPQVVLSRALKDVPAASSVTISSFNSFISFSELNSSFSESWFETETASDSTLPSSCISCHC